MTVEEVCSWVRSGAQDRAGPNFMRLASLGPDISILCGFLHSVLLLNAILGLDFLGLALSWPQVRSTDMAPIEPKFRHEEVCGEMLAHCALARGDALPF